MYAQSVRELRSKAHSKCISLLFMKCIFYPTKLLTSTLIISFYQGRYFLPRNIAIGPSEYQLAVNFDFGSDTYIRINQAVS